MTLREMWRFMGFKDEWIDKIKVSQFQQLQFLKSYLIKNYYIETN